MRVVAGSARGLRLDAPDGTDTRPTSDRVREAVFNALWSLGALEADLAVDLFAGSGALGIEALSRGVDHVTFVERDRRAAAVIDTNLERVRLADRASVLVAAVDDAWIRLPGPVDLALVDPPYAFDEWGALFADLRPRMAVDGIVVAESDRAVEPGAAWRVVRTKTYGGTVVSFVSPDDDIDPGVPA